MRVTVLLTIQCVVACVAGAETDAWRSIVLAESEHGLGGAAIGDLDPASSGNEVVAVSGGGEVWLARRGQSGWDHRCIHKGDGELIMCAIGDIDPRHAGNEFVGVGMVTGEESRVGRGQVLTIRKDGDGWSAARIFEDDHLIHGVAIGDVSSRRPGEEIVVCGFSHRVMLLYLAQGRWQAETIYVGSDRMKVTVLGDVRPERDGLEVLACGSDGKVVVLWEGELGWHHEIVYADAVGQSRVACADNGVLIGGDLGKVTLAGRQHGKWSSEVLTREPGKIRGVACADVDPRVPGAELYACGYSNNVIQLVRDERGFWTSTVVFTAQRPLHHLVAGDIDPSHPGVELVTCGHGGKLVGLGAGD